MKYMGSKNRIAKYIAPIIQTAIDNNNITTYVEPFAGGMNMIDKICCENRIANDIHPELIAMWQALQNGWQPPSHISFEEYNIVRANRTTLPPYYVGFVGFAASFGGRYFDGGYAREYKNDGITPRDYSNESYRNIMKQLPLIKNVSFVNLDYRELSIDNAVIYCDPPYENAKNYSIRKFDYDAFWNWCRYQNKRNILFVSSYEAPEDFKCIWQKDVIVNFDSNRDENSNKKRVEKLFVLDK